VIDAGYTGDIFAICWNIGSTAEVIKPGDRLAQIIPMPLSAEFMQWIKAPLEETARGAAGFGSTGS
jgi:dUTPase